MASLPSAPLSVPSSTATPTPTFKSLMAMAKARAPTTMLFFLSQACAEDQQRHQGRRPLSTTGRKLCTLEAGMILYGNSLSRKEQRARWLVLRLARAADGQDLEALARAVRAVWTHGTSVEMRKRRPILAAILKRIAQQQRTAAAEL